MMLDDIVARSNKRVFVLAPHVHNLYVNNKHDMETWHSEQQQQFLFIFRSDESKMELRQQLYSRGLRGHTTSNTEGF